MAWRDGTGREVGAGFRMGNICTPMANSCQCMAKPIQYCKVKKKKKNQKKENTFFSYNLTKRVHGQGFEFLPVWVGICSIDL